MPGNEMYDVFISYSRSDNMTGEVARFSSDLDTAFRRRTGRQLRIFFDTEEIKSRQIWKERIDEGLRASAVLVAMATRAYFRSDPCHYEWDHFLIRERAPQQSSVSPGIFPVYMYGEPDLRDGRPAEQQWLQDCKDRQCIDLAGAEHGSPQYSDQIMLLAEHIDDVINGAIDWSDRPADLNTEYHTMLTGHLGRGNRLVQLLAEALNVTIIGLTNESLPDALQDALATKRARENDHAFWRSLRIVFVDDKVLYRDIGSLLTGTPNHKEVLQQRVWEARSGNQAVKALLRRNRSESWNLYKIFYRPQFEGIIFSLQNGQNVIFIVVRRSQHAVGDQLYMEFKDTADQYFSRLFENIVHSGIEDRAPVPVGEPQGDKFICRGQRDRRSVLIDYSDASGWLPIFLVITFRNRDGHAEPLLALRSERSVDRELSRLSHISGHIYEDDRIRYGARRREQASILDLRHQSVKSAVDRVVQWNIKTATVGEPQPVRTAQYLHPDKEHLFFFVYAVELHGQSQIARQAGLRPFMIDDLMTVRKNQVLLGAVRVCQTAMPGRIRRAAAEIIRLNLVLHDQPELGNVLLDWAGDQGTGSGSTSPVELFDQPERESRRMMPSYRRDQRIMGLAGLQYREFFTMLLPLYEEFGVPGAADVLAQVRANPPKRQAMDRLKDLYQDELLMSSLPIEL